MLIHATRAEFIGATMGVLSCFQTLFSNPNDDVPNLSPSVSAFREPPPGLVDYADNPSVFGDILSGRKPCRAYRESADLLAFRDRTPKARTHALVIPKRRVRSVYSLTPSDADLVEDMRRMGLEVLEDCEPMALAADDYILCFHIPPFYSVDHLHLHVLAPASEMSFLNRYGKFRCGMRWCITDLDVMERLREGLPAVPYKQLF
ncbi:hypothetical protein ACHAWF_012807 [Thalassiosira exigua]